MRISRGYDLNTWTGYIVTLSVIAEFGGRFYEVFKESRNVA
ncbi:hypothetical protein LMG9449_1684 [Lactococcus lactis subsp. lactis]|uniref:Uncharacterized protein n=1 Tax=Lactococcus lactis subsp. lactis TaxID=1360 RepID=A0A0V8DV20_LACLL|nr:hypothetical protein [Lactococcus lactis]KSU17360.1 hypothetical protein LMG9449_1684 [Lactococcus lactis subsp. lactis]